MINLIPLLRADRKREMISYEEKGYIFREKKDSFLYVRDIKVSNYPVEDLSEHANKRNYIFQLRVTASEVRFYLCNLSENNKESCIYLTIYEIYELLLSVLKEYPLKELNRILQGKKNQVWYINYTGLEFRFNYFSESIAQKSINVPESSVKINYESLFLLIAIIQEKSNYLWKSADDEVKNKLVDGNIRLLSSLISTKGNTILNQHGWIYDSNLEKYKIDSRYKDSVSKYHLTEEEYKDIMEVKS